MLTLAKTKIKKIVIGFLLFTCLFGIKSFALVKPTSDFYVNDYAKLLNADTKDYIIRTNQSLCDKTGAQIVVVTVLNLEGRSLEEYATALFRKFGIGDKTKNNGVLLLLALEERQFRVEVGYGLEGILNDAKTGRIQDEFIIPYLKRDKWNEGIRNGFNAILQEVSDEYGVKIENTEKVTQKTNLITLSDDSCGYLLFAVMTISLIFGHLTRWVNKKFGIMYIIFLIGGLLFAWLRMNNRYLQAIAPLSIIGFIVGLYGKINRRWFF